jgi:urease beta subunit
VAVAAVGVADKVLPRRPTDPPRLRLEPFSTDGEPGRWSVHWRIHNDGSKPVQVKSGLQPHSRFHTDEIRIDREVAPGGSLEIALPVRFEERPGEVVENPFLILRVADGTDEWQLLVRVRVRSGERGEPCALSTPISTINLAGGAAS